MTSILTAMTCLLGALVSLALRLHWQAARDSRRQQTLTTLVTRLPTNTRLELDDIRDDGSRLRLRIVDQTWREMPAHEQIDASTAQSSAAVFRTRETHPTPVRRVLPGNGEGAGWFPRPAGRPTR